ncbi:tail fiber protein [Photorhabdus viridis]|uniref:tail fiber protein n=1 Tax=Photorhabdus viridis TaxID=3163327 RepID=UPI00387ECBF1
MAKNDFKAFATGENANTLSQEEYESLGFIEEGFKSGIARSEQLNKVWRQSSIIAAVIGKYIAEKTGEDVIDDGDLEKLVAQLDLALKQKITAEIPDASLARKGISQLNNATNSDREDQAATPKAVNDVRKMAEGKLSSVADATLSQKGIVQLSSATDSANETLAATPRAVKGAYDFANTANVAAKNAHDEANRATDNANSRLAKNQNGADIPNKGEFIKNLGLAETVNKANNAVPSGRRINGKSLVGDISLSAGDVGALPISSTLSAQTGTLRINNASNYPNIEFRASNKHFIGIEGTGGDYLTIYANNENGNRRYNLLTPEKSGTLATLDDITVNAVPNSRKVNGKALTGDISLSAGDVGAFKLGLTAYYPDIHAVPWNTDTGLYNVAYPGASALVAHFNNGVGSCPAFQLKVDYRNRGISYRSARDSYGFEEDWASIYTTKNKPSAEDVGALPGMTAFTGTSPGNEYQGVFSAQKDSYAKGINFGYVNYDTGQIYVNASGDLYAYFLHVNKNRYGGLVNTHPVGSPIPWPQPNPPSGYLACNGQAFNKSLYPQLAAAYPSGTLPDLRGEFIRGWDDGRGVDSGRGILSWQPATGNTDAGVSIGTSNPSGLNAQYGISETHPRNIAFNYIVRAA